MSDKRGKTNQPIRFESRSDVTVVRCCKCGVAIDWIYDDSDDEEPRQ